MKRFITIFLGIILTGQIFGQSEIRYSQDQIKQDFEYLYSTLKESHYNLFVNTPEKEYKEAFDNIMASISDSLTLIEVYRLFQPFVALSELGHCTMDYPFNRLYGTYIQNGGVLFPLNVQIEQNEVLVKGNYSKNDSIQLGSELLSINDKSIQNIKDDIYNYLSGESDYFKNTLLDMITFPRIMWILEESPTIYSVKIRDKNGKIFNVSLEAIPASNFEEMVNKEKQIFQVGRVLNFIDNIAYISPGPFMNANGNGNTSDTETFDKGEFYHFVDSAYSEIAKRKSTNLIIDLRNNSGGDNGFSDELLSYFADKPFRFCSKFEVKTSQITKDFWKQLEDSSLTLLKGQILSHENGEIFESEIPFKEPKIDSLRFKGDVYVLINRYSYSQATVTAAMIQDYGFGKVIGEETADVPTTYGSVHQFNLPISNIAVTYPKSLIVRPNGDLILRGTVPDYVVPRDVFSDKDEILDYAIDLIKNEN